MMRAVRFTLEDARAAGEAWGANCGPGAIAAVLQLTLEELRPHLHDFERKGYTNPSLMYAILRGLQVRYTVAMSDGRGDIWPSYGLARIQWEGPWTAPGVPMAARYRHTHWIGCYGEMVFDINCMSAGGWVPFAQWRDLVVPWLLKHGASKANGRWYVTHSIEIDPAVPARLTPSDEGYGDRLRDTISADVCTRPLMPDSPATFRCAQCGGVFEYGRPDEEAQAEAVALWGRRGDAPGMAIVCVDCFNEIMADVPTQES